MKARQGLSIETLDLAYIYFWQQSELDVIMGYMKDDLYYRCHEYLLLCCQMVESSHVGDNHIAIFHASSLS